jgi:GT2 family glycosyltransferase
MIDTAVVIANWNGKKHLKDCFDSLGIQTEQNFKIYFVDNGSEDDSVSFVEENWKKNIFRDRLEIIRFEKNTGFAKGYNTGIKKAFEDENIRYAIVLNNDTKLEEMCVEKLKNCAKKNSKAGSIQPIVLNFFEKNRIDCAGILLSVDGVATNRGYGEKNRSQYDQESEIFGANGTASLFTREALEKTQAKPGEYFDEDFFAYYEDVDLAWRMRLAGFKSYFCPEAKIFHVHSATAGKISGFKAYYLNRNRFFMIVKNYPFCRLMPILFALSPLRYIFLLYKVIMNKSRKNEELSEQKKSAVAKEIFRAWGSVIANIPDLLKKRHLIQRNKKVSCREIRRWFRDYKVKFLKTL